MLFRTTLITLLIFIPSLQALANEIDDLKTLTDVNRFLKKIKPDAYDDIALDDKNPSKTPFGKNTFHKADVNGDGATDLIVDGNYLFGVTSATDAKYEFYPIDRATFTLRRYTLLAISKVGGDTVLTVKPTGARDDMGPTEPVRKIRLVFKFGGWFELNSRPDDLSIERISMSTSGCYGKCPIFELTINRDRSATYNAKKFNEPDGTFYGKISSSDFDLLIKMINYVGLRTLRRSYMVGWTDDQTANLTIVYDRGRRKTISDYGMVGTFGLETIYDQLFALRQTQTWTAATK